MIFLILIFKQSRRPMRLSLIIEDRVLFGFIQQCNVIFRTYNCCAIFWKRASFAQKKFRHNNKYAGNDARAVVIQSSRVADRKSRETREARPCCLIYIARNGGRAQIEIIIFKRLGFEPVPRYIVVSTSAYGGRFKRSKRRCRQDEGRRDLCVHSSRARGKYVSRFVAVFPRQCAAIRTRSKRARLAPIVLERSETSWRNGAHFPQHTSPEFRASFRH